MVLVTRDLALGPVGVEGDAAYSWKVSLVTNIWSNVPAHENELRSLANTSFSARRDSRALSLACDCGWTVKCEGRTAPELPSCAGALVNE